MPIVLHSACSSSVINSTQDVSVLFDCRKMNCMKHKPQIRIGTSGYQYDHWVDEFYPSGLSKSHWLEYFSQRFDTVEINNTFYGLPKEDTFDKWRQQVPDDFCFILKFSRYGSHIKRLTNASDTIGLFLERATHLEDKLGPILVQLPPHWNVNCQRLADFLDVAPAEHRWAVEFRDPSWLCEDVFAILREHNAALCIHDLIEDHPHEITADWVYLRFHGGAPEGNYDAAFLRSVALQIKGYLGDGLDVYAYFNNDIHGYAIHNAMDLRESVAT